MGLAARPGARRGLGGRRRQDAAADPVQLGLPHHLHRRAAAQGGGVRLRDAPERLPARRVVPARLRRRLPRVDADPHPRLRQLLGDPLGARAAPAPRAEARARHARPRLFGARLAAGARLGRCPLRLRVPRLRHRRARALQGRLPLPLRAPRLRRPRRRRRLDRGGGAVRLRRALRDGCGLRRRPGADASRRRRRWRRQRR